MKIKMDKLIFASLVILLSCASPTTSEFEIIKIVDHKTVLEKDLPKSVQTLIESDDGQDCLIFLVFKNLSDTICELNVRGDDLVVLHDKTVETFSQSTGHITGLEDNFGLGGRYMAIGPQGSIDIFFRSLPKCEMFDIDSTTIHYNIKYRGKKMIVSSSYSFIYSKGSKSVYR
jgi:hypothetical protein